MGIKNSYRYFSNKECQYYTECHGGVEKNCMFCFCPLYGSDCKGNFAVLSNGLKDCSNCMIPHTEAGYDYIMTFLIRKPRSN
ncbi:MAG: cysteine-rich small domain-containing protein [Clostridiales bacterium]|nr:cysteine-rich small domain-containing protein [Clostridiales bacterium]